MIGFIIIIIAILLARSMNQRAMTFLTPEQQSLFLATFSKRRWLNIFVMIAQIAGYFLALNYTNWNPQIIMMVFFSSILLWIGIQAHLSYNEFMKLEFPQRVIQLYLLSSFVRLAGIIVYVIWISEDLKKVL